MSEHASNAFRTQTRLLSDVRDSANQQAWTDFHRIYAPMIRYFLSRMGLTEHDADDAAQEVLLAAHHALQKGSYDPTKGRFRGWLYGVARNKALLVHRNRRRATRAQLPSTDDADRPVDLLSNLEDTRDEDARSVWEQEWRSALLAEALRQVRVTMNEKVYLAFVGYGIERRPVQAVADELGLSVSSVYVYKQRALEAVKDWIARYEEEAPDSCP